MESTPQSAGTGAAPASVERLFQYSLLGMVTCGYLAVAGSGYLDPPTIALTACALALRFVSTLGLVRLSLSQTVVNVATLCYVAFYPLDYLFVSREFTAATVHLVFFLAIVKIVTARTDRDYMYVKIIAFLELLAASVLNGFLNFFVFLALYVVFAVATFASAEVRRAANGPVRVVRSGLRRMPIRLSLMTLFITGGILSMTLGLFFFLPRTARVAFRHLIPERYHLPGFSGEILLGQLGEIKQQSTPVMHVRFIKPDRPLSLKWRGATLARFNGRGWFNAIPEHEDRLTVERGGLARLIDARPSRRTERLEYEVHAKDIGTGTLFFAGTPEYVNINAAFIRRIQGGSFRAPFASPNGLQYIGYAYLSGPASAAELAPEKLPPVERAEYLELPRLDSRIAALANQWTAGAPDPEARAAAIEQHLRRDYSYSLDLLKVEVADPLAHFLFERRAGHCEYFASAMAVMLRTLGIPARVATGFQSGIYNPVSGWQVIRASDAHSWVEAYLPRSGWTTFDPTPPDPNFAQMGLGTRLSLYMDAAETFWQEWVLNYDLEHQLVLATKVQQTSRGPRWFESLNGAVTRLREDVVAMAKRYGAPLAAAVVFAGLAIVYGPRVREAWAVRRRCGRVQRGQADRSDASLLYLRMLRLLERRGIEKPAWVTANEFVRLVADPVLAPMVEDATALYHEIRFGNRPTAGPRMLAVIERMERS